MTRRMFTLREEWDIYWLKRCIPGANPMVLPERRLPVTGMKIVTEACFPVRTSNGPDSLAFAV